MYQALYRKWRPRTFDEVVGQTHITQTLKRQVQAGRLSHAYLFTGTRGTGKTTCAKILARAVNCEHPQDGNPCNQCPSCVGIENGSILDVLELDAASNNRVDDIRAILDEAVYTPATVKKRVYIVDEVHMLSAQAFNALLQILEEPPAHLMFILATTEVHKVPATIKSRCQQFAFKRIPAQEIAARLTQVAQAEGMELTEGGTRLLARLASGGMRDALSLLDQCAGPGGRIDEDRVRTVLGLAGNLEVAALVELAAEGDIAQVLDWVDRLYSSGKDMGALAGELSALVRDLLVYQTTGEAGAALLSGGYDLNTLERLSGRFSRPRLVQMLHALQDTASALRSSANQRTDVELCLVCLCDPTLDISPAGLAARLDRLEREGAAAVPAAQSPAAPRRDTPLPAARPASAPAFEAPPWESDTPARPERTAEVVQQPAPDRAQAQQQQAPAMPDGADQPEAAPAARGWPGWRELLKELKKGIDVGDFTFLSNEAMVAGRWDGKVLTLWTENEFVYGQMSKNKLTGQISQLAGKAMGLPVHVMVRLGQAPPEVEAEGERAPAQEGPDALELFLQDNRDNVSVD